MFYVNLSPDSSRKPDRSYGGLVATRLRYRISHHTRNAGPSTHTHKSYTNLVHPASVQRVFSRFPSVQAPRIRCLSNMEIPTQTLGSFASLRIFKGESFEQAIN